MQGNPHVRFFEGPGPATAPVYSTPLGRLTSVTDALGQVTSYTFDEVGNFTSQTDANGHTTRFVYDSMGRQVARVLPGGGHDLARYDQAGRMDEEHTLSGSMRLYEHDNAGRVLQRRYPLRKEQVDITYNKMGLRETIKDRAGRVTVLQYDEQNRLKRKVDPRGWVLDYGYDPAGNRTSLKAIVGDETLETTYTFDELNRIETITDPTGGVYSYSYDPNGNPETLTYPNGVVTTWTFDSQNRLDSLVTKDASGEVLQSYDYTLALTGHRTAIEERGGPRSGTRREYAYDDLWRLTEDRVTGPDGTLEFHQEFQYDPVGNRLFDTLTDDIWKGRIAGYSYDERDRLVLRNGRPWEWDRGGRLLEEAGYEGWWIPGRSYEWDDDERLLSVEWTEHERLVGIEPGRLENVYDADGHRIESTETQDGESTTTQYLVDESGWLSHVVAEIRDGEVVTHYQRAGDQLLGLVREGATEDRYFHLDGLGSVRSLTDASGTVTDRYEYTAFGERLESGEDPQPYGFTGEPWSSVMELAHHRARWMDPAVGRFLSVDPLDVTQTKRSMHSYFYADASPANFLDRTGLIPSSINSIFIGLGAIGILATRQQFLANPTPGNAGWYIGSTISSAPLSVIRAFRGLGRIAFAARLGRGLNQSENAALLYQQSRGWKLFMGEEQIIQYLHGGARGAAKLADTIVVAGGKLKIISWKSNLKTNKVIGALKGIEDTARALLEKTAKHGGSIEDIDEAWITFTNMGENALQQGFTVKNNHGKLQLFRDGSPVKILGKIPVYLDDVSGFMGVV